MEGGRGISSKGLMNHNVSFSRVIIFIWPPCLPFTLLCWMATTSWLQLLPCTALPPPERADPQILKGPCKARHNLPARARPGLWEQISTW